MLMGLLRQVELCQAQCKEMLMGPINLKVVPCWWFIMFSQKIHSVRPNILCISFWIFAETWCTFSRMGWFHYQHSRVKTFEAISQWCYLVDFLFEREDQENVVNELSSIQRDGELLKIQGLIPTACISSLLFRFVVSLVVPFYQFINHHVWLMCFSQLMSHLRLRLSWRKLVAG